jgi:hypothetical protein
VASWVGDTLLVHSPVDDPDPVLGTNITLKLIYYLEHEQLVIEKGISQAGKDLDGTQSKRHYKKDSSVQVGRDR